MKLLNSIPEFNKPAPTVANHFGWGGVQENSFVGFYANIFLIGAFVQLFPIVRNPQEIWAVRICFLFLIVRITRFPLYSFPERINMLTYIVLFYVDN